MYSLRVIGDDRVEETTTRMSEINLFICECDENTGKMTPSILQPY